MLVDLLLPYHRDVLKSESDEPFHFSLGFGGGRLGDHSHR